LFNIYLDCGRLINLQDWYEAFKSVCEYGDDQVCEEELQARFMKGLGELSFLGFVRPTGRKTDHVVRLTWGEA
jgi:origin recognition complex subunit 3